MDMGAMGKYHLFENSGQRLGGIMKRHSAEQPVTRREAVQSVG
jgi:hypothetical protein